MKKGEKYKKSKLNRINKKKRKEKRKRKYMKNCYASPSDLPGYTGR